MDILEIESESAYCWRRQSKEILLISAVQLILDHRTSFMTESHRHFRQRDSSTKVKIQQIRFTVCRRVTIIKEESYDWSDVKLDHNSNRMILCRRKSRRKVVTAEGCHHSYVTPLQDVRFSSVRLTSCTDSNPSYTSSRDQIRHQSFTIEYWYDLYFHLTDTRFRTSMWKSNFTNKYDQKKVSTTVDFDRDAFYTLSRSYESEYPDTITRRLAPECGHRYGQVLGSSYRRDFE